VVIIKIIGKKVATYLLGLSLAANQAGNAIMGGKPTQTISYRAGMARDRGAKFGTGVCAVLNKIDWHHERPNEDHCAKAVRHHIERNR
jgi:hypothetical protein